MGAEGVAEGGCAVTATVSKATAEKAANRRTGICMTEAYHRLIAPVSR